MPFAALPLLAWSSFGVLVTGAGTCPDPATVQARLSNASAAETDSLTGRIEREPSGVRLSLVDHSGRLLAERLLPESASCEALANASAAILSAWLLSLTQVELVAPPSSDPRVSSPVSPASPPGWQWQLGAAAIGGFSDSLAPGVELEASVVLLPHWCAQVEALWDGPRSASLAPGSVTWQRVILAAGPSYRLTARAWVVELGVRIAGSLLWISGSGYNGNDQTAVSFDPGATVTGRLVLTGHRFRPWLGLSGAGWFRAEAAAVTNVGRQDLPQLEALGGLGVDWALQ